MTYRICPETNLINAHRSSVYAARGAANREYRQAESIANLHERVAARAEVRDELARLDKEENDLNRMLAKFECEWPTVNP